MNEHRIVYEEIPGSRTTQDAISQPQRERIAYEELQSGDRIQPGDEWKNGDGRWQPYVCLTGLLQFVQDGHAARRPYKISTIQEIGDALANAQKAATQLQDERNEFQTALIESRLALRRKVADIMEVCKERDEVEAELKRLQEVVGNLYSEPTARQVQDMLRTWATELDWSTGCFDSVAREQIDTIQKTLVAVIERIEGMLNPEGGTDGE